MAWSSRQAGRLGRVVAVSVGAIGLATVAGVACAQEFGERPLTVATTVPLTIDSREFLPSASGLNPGDYAPLLDMRRRVIANSWVRSAVISGPHDDTRRLSPDVCVEDPNPPNDTVFPRSPPLPCTPIPEHDVDRVEVYWGWSYAAREAVARSDDLNREFLRIGLSAHATGGNSLLFPGLFFRFTSGPPPPWLGGEPTWTSMATAGGPPRGEDSGFRIDRITLRPSLPPGARGFRNPLTIAPYERVSGVLLGGAPWTTEDSVTVRLERRPRQTLAVWLDPASSAPVHVYARCGAAPTHTAPGTHIFATSRTPAYITLTSACPEGWFVTIVNISAGPAAFHMRVGAHRAGREWSNVRVGIESPTSGPAEDAFIRATLRLAAWRLYGTTGGTQLIHSFVYTTPGSCTDVTICWRNRPPGRGISGCEAGRGYYYAGGSLGTVHLCLDPRDPGFPVGRAANLLGHEFGHLFTGTGLIDSWLQDEYFRSESPSNEICGWSDVWLSRCTHSMMSYSWDPRIVSLCVPGNHNRAVEVMWQTPPWTMPVRLAIADGPDTITECTSGAVNRTGPYGESGNSGWSQLWRANAVPAPHPAWTPDNFDFLPFVNSSVNRIGGNVD